MKKILNIISIILTHIVPFLILITRHIYTSDGGLNLTLVGWLLAVILVYYLYFKPFGEKVKVWEIQDKKEFFVYNFKKSRIIIVLTIIYFLFSHLTMYYDEASTTLLLMIGALVAGWFVGLFALNDDIELE